MIAEPVIFEMMMTRLRDFTVDEIAWPANNYSPKSDTAYLRPTLLFGASGVMGVADNDSSQYSGIFQVDVFWPENQGLTAPLDLAADLAEHFNKGLDLSEGAVKIKITNKPMINSALQEPGWVQVPVSIPWRAFA